MFKVVSNCFFVLFFIIFIFSNKSIAGQHSGGGGGGVYCENNGVKTLVTLDYWEAMHRMVDDGTGNSTAEYWSPDFYKDAEKLDPRPLNQKNDSVLQDKFLEVLKPLPLLLNRIATVSEGEAHSSYQNIESLNLNEYADSGREFSFPAGCRYVQLIVRDGEIFKINTEMFDLLNEKQLAYINLHEYLYWAAKTYGNAVEDSREIRQMVGNILDLVYPDFGSQEHHQRAPKNSHASYYSLCKLGESVGLCSVHVSGTRLFQEQNSTVFEGFYTDITDPLTSAMEDFVDFTQSDLTNISSELKSSGDPIVDQNMVNKKTNDFQKELNNSDNKILTASAILLPFRKIEEQLELNCDYASPLPTGERLEICQNYFTAFRVGFTRLTKGYNKMYCIENATAGRLCGAIIKVPGVDISRVAPNVEVASGQMFKFLDNSDVWNIEWLTTSDSLYSNLLKFSN